MDVWRELERRPPKLQHRYGGGLPIEDPVGPATAALPGEARAQKAAQHRREEGVVPGQMKTQGIRK
jgi:hypothetical protein